MAHARMKPSASVALDPAVRPDATLPVRTQQRHRALLAFVDGDAPTVPRSPVGRSRSGPSITLPRRARPGSALAGGEVALAQPVDSKVSELQRFTPTIEALAVPDIDSSLDEAPAKTAFWNAFKSIGPWWAELPPY